MANRLIDCDIIRGFDPPEVVKNNIKIWSKVVRKELEKEIGGKYIPCKLCLVDLMFCACSDEEKREFRKGRGNG